MRRRRALMTNGGKPYDEYGYINKGKILHLDAVDYGDNASTWIELTSGLVFTKYGDVSIGSNRIWFPGNTNSYYECNGKTIGAISDGTIEFCINPSNASAAIFAVNPQGAYNPVIYKNNSVYTWCQYNNTYTISTTLGNDYSISLNTDIGCVNGVAINKNSGTDYWSTDSNLTKITIGCRHNTNGYTNPYKGYIYSIRIYDRRLSLEEMQHNQQIDNSRFSLNISNLNS